MFQNAWMLICIPWFLGVWQQPLEDLLECCIWTDTLREGLKGSGHVVEFSHCGRKEILGCTRVFCETTMV